MPVRVAQPQPEERPKAQDLPRADSQRADPLPVQPVPSSRWVASWCRLGLPQVSTPAEDGRQEQAMSWEHCPQGPLLPAPAQALLQDY